MFASFSFRIARGLGSAHHMIYPGKKGSKAWSSPFSKDAQRRFFYQKRYAFMDASTHGIDKKWKLLAIYQGCKFWVGS
jgi:hypothetical protein